MRNPTNHYQNKELINIAHRRKEFYLVFRPVSGDLYIVYRDGPDTAHNGFRGKVISFLNGASGFQAGMDVHKSHIRLNIGRFSISDYQTNFKNYCGLAEFHKDLEKFKELKPEVFV